MSNLPEPKSGPRSARPVVALLLAVLLLALLPGLSRADEASDLDALRAASSAVNAAGARPSMAELRRLVELARAYLAHDPADRVEQIRAVSLLLRAHAMLNDHAARLADARKYLVGADGMFRALLLEHLGMAQLETGNVEAARASLNELRQVSQTHGVALGLPLTRRLMLAGEIPPPDIDLIDVDGHPWKLSEHRGKPVLLDFWDDQPPCRAMLRQYLTRIHAGWTGAGLQLVSISAVEAEKQLAYFTSASDNGSGIAGWTRLIDPGHTARRGYGVSSVPYLVLLDREGKCVVAGSGWTVINDVLAELRQRLGEPGTVVDDGSGDQTPQTRPDDGSGDTGSGGTGGTGGTGGAGGTNGSGSAGTGDPAPQTQPAAAPQTRPSAAPMLRVLLIDGETRYETDYLLSTLQAAPRISYHALFLGAEPDAEPEARTDTGEPPIIALPACKTPEEQLAFADAWDVVILGDVHRSMIGGSFLSMLRLYVTVHGKPLILLAGTNRYLRALAGSPLDEVLPVLITGATREPAPLPGVVRPWHLTAAGRASAALRLVPDADASAALWQETFSGFTWFLPVDAPKPEATVLLNHPLKVTGTDLNGQPVEQTVQAPDGLPFPLLVEMQAGKGRTLAMLSDEFWYMRGGNGDNRHHSRMWLHLLRHMAGQPVDADGEPQANDRDGSGNGNGNGE